VKGTWKKAGGCRSTAPRMIAASSGTHSKDLNFDASVVLPHCDKAHLPNRVFSHKKVAQNIMFSTPTLRAEQRVSTFLHI